MQPPILFELLPAFGFLLCISSLSYLWVMRSKQSDVLAIVYAFQSFDALIGLSLFYTGFHGSFVTANTDDNTFIKPVKCLLAFHLSVWVVIDFASAIILLILCIDQIISIVFTKTHKNISWFYMQPCMMFLLFILSFGVLKPAWSYALDNAENSTISISPFCSMGNVFGEDFYEIDIAIRMITPLIGLILLFVAAFLLLFYQLAQNWQFKWSDNNEESVRYFYYAAMKVLLTALTIHLPIWFFFRPKVETSDEICLRMFYAGVMGIIQPIFLLKLFPDYWIEMKKFFSKYSQNTKRTWQSADDPPNCSKGAGSIGLDFGSWYSSAGNIIGECGVPYELNADKQKSISFYCNEMEHY